MVVDVKLRNDIKMQGLAAARRKKENHVVAGCCGGIILRFCAAFRVISVFFLRPDIRRAEPLTPDRQIRFQLGPRSPPFPISSCHTPVPFTERVLFIKLSLGGSSLKTPSTPLAPSHSFGSDITIDLLVSPQQPNVDASGNALCVLWLVIALSF